MGRVGAMAIRSTNRCRWFLFYCCCFLLHLIVAFHCCSPSIHDDVHEFWAIFWVGRKRGSILYSPKYSKICILRLRQPALCSLSTRGYTNKKNQFSREKSRALDTIQREYSTPNKYSIPSNRKIIILDGILTKKGIGSSRPHSLDILAGSSFQACWEWCLCHLLAGMPVANNIYARAEKLRRCSTLFYTTPIDL